MYLDGPSADVYIRGKKDKLTIDLPGTGQLLLIMIVLLLH